MRMCTHPACQLLRKGRINTSENHYDMRLYPRMAVHSELLRTGVAVEKLPLVKGASSGLVVRIFLGLGYCYALMLPAPE